jgi:hypothetical protein
MDVERVPHTKELQKRGNDDRTTKVRDYLFAVGYRSASQVMWRGEWMHPMEIPLKERQRLDQVRKEWKYPGAST